MKKYALIVAGGSGSRMGSSLPKQFLEIHQLPILMHTLYKFYQADASIEIILVIAAEAQPTWQVLVQEHNFKIPFRLAKGGQTRTESVRNGLAAIPDQFPSLVAIHDGVRPCISTDIILKSYQVAMQKGTAITAVALKDSIREYTTEQTQARSRENYCLVQTPQTFQTDLIRQAYQTIDANNLTDDASVAESAGFAIHLIEGDYRNIKATTPEDLKVLEVFLEPI